MVYTIIGGTGVPYEKENIKSVETPYGNVEYTIISENPRVYFIPRHGFNHETPPHKVNYRAQMVAAKIFDSHVVFGMCAVGSCSNNKQPGDLVLCHDFLDFTKNRVNSYFNGEDHITKHIGMDHPYCPDLRDRVITVAKESQIKIHDKGVYVCTEGPRFETTSEIKFYHMIGGEVVGMTNVPEVVLACELGLCYVAIAMVSNWCTGFQASNYVSFEKGLLLEAASNASNLIRKTIKSIEKKPISCSHSNDFI